jgi:hypothetical protein
MWHPHLTPSLTSPPDSRVQGSLDPWRVQGGALAEREAAPRNPAGPRALAADAPG